MLTEAELAQRRGLITSSIVAACLGLDARTTRIQAALRARGQEDEDTANAKACDRGDRLEAIVLESVADKRGWAWHKPSFVQRPDAPWAGDSCDAIYSDDNGPQALGEAKTAALGMAGGFGEEGTDEIPHSALLQSQWHMWHHDMERCFVPVLVGGYRFEFREYLVKRDETLIREMTAELQEFHRLYVAGDSLPPVEAGDTEWLSRRWPEHTEEWASDSGELYQLVAEKVAASAAAKAATEREDCAKNRLREYLGETQGCKASWGSVYYRRSKGRATTDWKRLAHDLAGGEVPEHLVMTHTRIAPGPRVLRVYPGKDQFNV